MIVSSAPPSQNSINIWNKINQNQLYFKSIFSSSDCKKSGKRYRLFLLRSTHYFCQLRPSKIWLRIVHISFKKYCSVRTKKLHKMKLKKFYFDTGKKIMIFKLELSPQNFHYDVLYPLYLGQSEKIDTKTWTYFMITPFPST